MRLPKKSIPQGLKPPFLASAQEARAEALAYVERIT